jgi:hypothetical protein
MTGLLQVSEQVWVPLTSIKRISLFSGTVTVMYWNDISEEFTGEDAERILDQIRK